jgi:hypothetical protein
MHTVIPRSSGSPEPSSRVASAGYSRPSSGRGTMIVFRPNLISDRRPSVTFEGAKASAVPARGAFARSEVAR